MPDPIRIAFEREIVMLPTSAVLPLRKVSDVTKQTTRFKRIAASIAEVGIIEPIVVARPRRRGEPHLLLDGHMRYAILADLGSPA
jgi:ParB-like chromosome segregation protein Spo0J